MLQIDGFEDFVEIGSGGFSTVYRAKQIQLDRYVAVKVLELQGADVSRIGREIAALGRLSGVPNVITAYELKLLDDGRPALIMALMSTSLGALIKDDADHSEELYRLWLPQLATALDAAHTLGIFHRDLKPDNVLISDAGDAYLADFGISGVDTLELGTATSGSLTPQHASPERLADRVTDSVADDVYSFGSTVYMAVAGHPPFGTARSGGLSGLITRIANDPVPMIEGLSETANEVFRRVLAKDPAQRYRSATEFARALSSSGPTSAAGRSMADDQIDDLTIRRIPKTAHPQHPRHPPLTTRPQPTTDADRPTSTAHPIGLETWPEQDAELLEAAPISSPSRAATDPVDDRSRRAGERPVLRRRPVQVLGVALAIVLAAGAWYVFSGGSEPESASTIATTTNADDADSGTIDQIIQLLDGRYTSMDGSVPTELVECVAKSIIDRADDPIALTKSMMDPELITNPDADDLLKTLDEIETDCAKQVITLGPSTEFGRAAGLALSEESTCVLITDGAIACWGSNMDGIAFDDEGFGPSVIDEPIATSAPPAKKVVSAPRGGDRCIISTDDRLVCTAIFAALVAGQEDDPDGDPLSPLGGNGYVRMPAGLDRYVEIPGFGAIKDVDIGFSYVCAVRTDGTVWCQGINASGELGIGNRIDTFEPVQVSALTGIDAITAGHDHTCALGSDGSVWCWGVPGYTLAMDLQPVRIEGLPKITQISAGRNGFSCGIGDDASVWCWGPLSDILGNRDLEGSRGPVRIDAPVGAIQMDVDGTRACFAGSDHEVYCFGDGRPLPKQLTFMGGVVQVDLSPFSLCGLDTDGRVQCTGRAISPDSQVTPTESGPASMIPLIGDA